MNSRCLPGATAATPSDSEPYVRHVSINGDDNWDGLTPGTPWRSWAKVRSWLGDWTDKQIVVHFLGDDFRTAGDPVIELKGFKVYDQGALLICGTMNPVPIAAGIALGTLTSPTDVSNTRNRVTVVPNSLLSMAISPEKLILQINDPGGIPVYNYYGIVLDWYDDGVTTAWMDVSCPVGMGGAVNWSFYQSLSKVPKIVLSGCDGPDENPGSFGMGVYSSVGIGLAGLDLQGVDLQIEGCHGVGVWGVDVEFQYGNGRVPVDNCDHLIFGVWPVGWTFGSLTAIENLVDSYFFQTFGVPGLTSWASLGLVNYAWISVYNSRNLLLSGCSLYNFDLSQGVRIELSNCMSAIGGYVQHVYGFGHYQCVYMGGIIFAMSAVHHQAPFFHDSLGTETYSLAGVIVADDCRYDFQGIFCLTSDTHVVKFTRCDVYLKLYDFGSSLVVVDASKYIFMLFATRVNGSDGYAWSPNNFTNLPSCTFGGLPSAFFLLDDDSFVGAYNVDKVASDVNPSPIFLCKGSSKLHLQQLALKNGAVDYGVLGAVVLEEDSKMVVPVVTGINANGSAVAMSIRGGSKVHHVGGASPGGNIILGGSGAIAYPAIGVSTNDLAAGTSELCMIYR